MVGFLLVSLYAIGAGALASGIISRFQQGSSWANGFGVSGLVGLGAVGTITYFAGLVNKGSGIYAGLTIFGALSVIAIGGWFIHLAKNKPKIQIDRLALLSLIPLVVSLVAVGLARTRTRPVVFSGGVGVSRQRDCQKAYGHFVPQACYTR